MAQGVFGGLHSLFASGDKRKGKLRCCWLFVSEQVSGVSFEYVMTYITVN